MIAVPPLVLVDSSYFITWQNQGQNPFARLDRHKARHEFAINGIVWGEVVRGRSDPHVRDRYEKAFALTRLLHLSASGWQRVAGLAWEMDRKGDLIPLTDIIIGVSALEHGACVLTFDRHYQKIPGLIVVSDLG
jgi:predicted nucleic acid-binding protein